MAEEANLHLEDSLAAWTGDGSRMWCRGSWLLTFWLAFVILLQQSVCLTGCSAFVQRGASPNTVLSSVFPSVGVDVKRCHVDLQIVFKTFLLPPLVNAYLLVAHRNRVFSSASGLACELHGLPIVTETASGWSGCWVSLLEQGSQCPGSCPAT